MSSRSFGSKGPGIPHRVKPGNEFYDLRKDVEEAFSSLEAETGAVALAADLSTLDDSVMQDRAVKYCKQLEDFFVLDKSSAATIDGVTFVGTLSGTGRWRRLCIPHLKWQAQATFYFDATLGSDLNDGSTTGTPLKTWAEWYRRTGGIFRQVTSLRVVSAPPTDSFAFGVESIGGNYQLFLYGVRTVVRSGTASSYVAADSSAGVNEAPTVTDVSVTDWTPDVGRMLLDTTSGKWCIIMKDLGGGKARVSYWNVGYPATATSTPAAGDYSVVSLSPLSARATLKSLAGFLVFYDFEVSTPCLGTSWRYIYSSCRFTGGVSQMAGAQVLGCSITGSGSSSYFNVNGAGLPLLFNGCGIMVRCGSIQGGTTTFYWCVIQGDGTSAKYISAGFPDVGGVPSSILMTGDVGIFDTGGLFAEKGSTISVGGNLYGKGNIVGLSVRERANVLVRSSVTPTLTGTTEIDLPGGGTEVPALVAGGAVPAASPLTTWSEWAAAPFNRRVVCMTTDYSAILNET